MRYVAFLSLVSLLVLGACGEHPTESVLSPDEPAFARADGYRMVLVKEGFPEPAIEAGAPVVSSLSDAVARVAPGGLIKVFPGTHPAEEAVIDKPITITGAGNGPAILRTEASAVGLRVVNGGSLTLRGLEFENAGATASVLVRGDASTLDVSDVAFRVDASGFSALYFGDMTPGSSLAVQRSSFEGGGYGLIGIVPTMDVRASTFTGQRWVSLYFTGEGTVEGNTMTDCGDNACIFAVGGATGTISGNELSNGRTGPGPVDEGTGTPIPQYAFFHHVILVFSGSDVDIIGNEIDGCGWGQCITTGVGGRALIEDNRFVAYQSQGTRMAIVAGDGVGGSSGNPADAGHAVVRNNEFVGVSDPITDRGDINQYAYRIAALLAEGVGTTLVAEGNTGSSARAALVARAGGAVSGSGNAFDLLQVATSIWDAGTTMDVHGSDFTDYVDAIQQSGNTSSSLTCNYWGPGGPSGVFADQGASLYTPWATSPIAATGQTSGCTDAL